MKSRLAIVILAIMLTLSAGASYAGGKDLSLVPSNGPLAHQTVYSGSYALLIGVNNYQNLPNQLHLHYAVDDATSMRDMLIKYYGFPPDHIRMLLDGDATKKNIIDAFSDFADQDTYHHDDRILIFFSGHGQTVNLPGGGKEGFLIPVDARVQLNNIDNAAPFLKTCVQMSEVWDYLNSSPAKHVLLIADACYSGLLTQNRSLGISSGALVAIASKRALQVMTAGGQGETSSEMDAYGHGAFTYKLLEELKARGQTPGDIFTTSELYAAVERSVADATNGAQDPQFGNYKTEGDFLFITTKPQKVPEMTKVAVLPDDTNDNNNDNSDDNNKPHPYAPPAPVKPPAVTPQTQKHNKYAAPEKYGSKVIAIIPFSGTFAGAAQQFWPAYSNGLFSQMSSQIQQNFDGYSVPSLQQTEQAISQARVQYSTTGYGYLTLEQAKQIAQALGARYVIMGQFSVDEKVKPSFINRYDVEINGNGQMLDPATGDVIAKLDGHSKKSKSFVGQITPYVQTDMATANAGSVKDVADQLTDGLKDALGGG